MNAEGQAVESQVFFYGHFSQAIERKGNLRERFLHRKGFFVHVAIGGSGGGENHPLYAVFPAAFHDMNGTCNVLVHIVLRIYHGVAHQGLGSQVDYSVKMFLAEEVFHFVVMGVHHFQPGSFRQVFPKACGKIVQGNDLIPCFHELTHQMGTNKAGTAGYKNLHNFTFFYRNA